MFGILFVFALMEPFRRVLGVTNITDDNFHSSISTCLSTNPVDGLCYFGEYGPMPDWDVSEVTNMFRAFYQKGKFNGNISKWDVSKVTNMTAMF